MMFMLIRYGVSVELGASVGGRRGVQATAADQPSRTRPVAWGRRKKETQREDTTQRRMGAASSQRPGLGRGVAIASGWTVQTQATRRRRADVRLLGGLAALNKALGGVVEGRPVALVHGVDLETQTK